MAFDGRSNESLSQINVTPLVDVMLVLLVIFMVTAPILHQGVTVNLPSVGAGSLTGDEAPLVVNVTAAGDVYLNDTSMSAVELRNKLAAIVRERPDQQVFLRADTEVSYGVVVAVMGALREAGVLRLGMVTKPPETE
jgi:biopolymer transport protein TolR